MGQQILDSEKTGLKKFEERIENRMESFDRILQKMKLKKSRKMVELHSFFGGIDILWCKDISRNSKCLYCLSDFVSGSLTHIGEDFPDKSQKDLSSNIYIL